MNNKNSDQNKLRDKYTNNIVNDPSNKKIIVSGPGTGKTFTFGKIFENKNKNLALTFIRKLTSEMNNKYGDNVECRTFHEYCKKILHQHKVNFTFEPFLSKVIELDAQYLENGLQDFDEKIQSLDEYGPEIPFYLKRSEYYETVSFNDSVYRVYKIAKEKPDIIPEYDQIVIDEY